MTRNLFVSIIVIFLLFAAPACAQVQHSTPTYTASRTPETAPTIQPTLVLAESTSVVPTATAAPSPDHSLTSIPSAAASPTPQNMGPFQFVAPLTGLLKDPAVFLEMYAFDNGSIWGFSNQLNTIFFHWDQSTGILREVENIQNASPLVLHTLDALEQEWELNLDTGEMSKCLNGVCKHFAAESGWIAATVQDSYWWQLVPWRVFSMADGKRWTSVGEDVRTFDGNRWSIYSQEDMGFPVPTAEDVSIVHTIVIARGEEIWVGECYYSGPGPMGGGGVRWFDGQIWQGANSPVGTNCVSALGVDTTGDVWLGVPGAIWHYQHDDQSWAEYYFPKEFLTGYNFTHPRKVLVDANGSAWVMMEFCGGASCSGPVNLYRLHAGEWSLVAGSEYWESSFKQLILDGNGTAWLFWEGLIYQLVGELTQPATTLDTRGVAVSSDGHIWVVAGNGDNAGIWVLEP